MSALLAWPDPLGVRADCAAEIATTSLVQIDEDALTHLSERLFEGAPDLPAWETRLHFSGTPEQTANWLLALDSVNFCFWGTPRWTIEFRGEALSGYWGLAGAFTRAVKLLDFPLWDAEFLAGLSDKDARAIFAGTDEIPLLPARVENLREVGRVLLDEFNGSFLNVVGRTGGSAPDLAGLVARAFRSFSDVAAGPVRTVRLYKRAQLLAADLVGAFGGTGPGALTNLDGLTAFADYKLPQVLRHHGVLRYAPDLAARVDRQELLPPGSPEEVAIRAATVLAADQLAAQSPAFGRAYLPYQVDWLLWHLGQSLPPDCAPYHRTLTIYY